MRPATDRNAASSAATATQPAATSASSSRSASAAPPVRAVRRHRHTARQIASRAPARSAAARLISRRARTACSRARCPP
jgi:hypothetical protein